MAALVYHVLVCDRCRATVPPVEGTSRQARAEAARFGWMFGGDVGPLVDLCPNCRPIS